MSNVNKFQLLDELEDIRPDDNLKQSPEVPDPFHLSEVSVDKSKQVPLDILDLDNKLSQKTQIKIDYVYNKKDKNESYSRVFNVVSKHTYDNIKKLIMRYKTHKNDKVNWEEQNVKIKLANNFMGLCYKDPTQKCTYIYPVVIITLKNGKTVTKNSVHEDSSLQFTINDILYNMYKEPNTDLK